MTSLLAHLQSGATTVCRALSLKRADGQTFGFTDHDDALFFEGIDFAANAALTASAFERTNGLSVDNADVLGVLTDDGISAEDIRAGLFDGAEVRLWHVNWQDVSQRELIFKGTLGEIRTSGTQFEAELRGLSDALNVTRGRTYQTGCSAVFGDAHCGVDLLNPLYTLESALVDMVSASELRVANPSNHEDGWFQRGLLRFDQGVEPLLIKHDRIVGDERQITLWQPLDAQPASGVAVTLTAGCDKRFETCRYVFDNALNFRGFPDIPGDDWLLRYPGTSEPMDGGSRR